MTDGGKASEKGSRRSRSASKNSRNSSLVAGAEWPKDSEGKRKKVADFTKQEKQLILCTFERKAKGGCTKKRECDFRHDIPEAARKGKDDSNKVRSQPSGGAA